MITIALTLNNAFAASVSLTNLLTPAGTVPAGAALPTAFSGSGMSWTVIQNVGPDSSYNYVATVTYSDGSSDIIEGTYIAFQGYVGRYISETQLKLYIGTQNVIIRSDADSNGTENVNAIALAIQQAEDEVDSILSVVPAPYAIPITFASGVINQSFAQQVMDLATAALAEKRLIDFNDNKSIPSYRKRATEWLQWAWYGDRVIVGATLSSAAQRQTAWCPSQPRSILPQWGLVYPFGWGFWGFGYNWGWGWGW